MTQEIKDKLEQEATEYASGKSVSFTDPWYIREESYKAGAQTILDNPKEWGLATKEVVMSKIKLLHDVESRWWIKVKELESQLFRYREALEEAKECFEELAFLSASDQASVNKGVKAIKEALKQQDND
jgi:hypothetical protein